mgnify:CR=1 FL=1
MNMQTKYKYFLYKYSLIHNTTGPKLKKLVWKGWLNISGMVKTKTSYTNHKDTTVTCQAP